MGGSLEPRQELGVTSARRLDRRTLSCPSLQNTTHDAGNSSNPSEAWKQDRIERIVSVSGTQNSYPVKEPSAEFRAWVCLDNSAIIAAVHPPPTTMADLQPSSVREQQDKVLDLALSQLFRTPTVRKSLGRSKSSPSFMHLCAGEHNLDDPAASLSPSVTLPAPEQISTYLREEATETSSTPSDKKHNFLADLPSEFIDRLYLSVPQHGPEYAALSELLPPWQPQTQSARIQLQAIQYYKETNHNAIEEAYQPLIIDAICMDSIHSKFNALMILAENPNYKSTMLPTIVAQMLELLHKSEARKKVPDSAKRSVIIQTIDGIEPPELRMAWLDKVDILPEQLEKAAEDNEAAILSLIDAYTLVTSGLMDCSNIARQELIAPLEAIAKVTKKEFLASYLGKSIPLVLPYHEELNEKLYCFIDHQLKFIPESNEYQAASITETILTRFGQNPQGIPKLPLDQQYKYMPMLINTIQAHAKTTPMHMAYLQALKKIVELDDSLTPLMLNKLTSAIASYPATHPATHLSACHEPGRELPKAYMRCALLAEQASMIIRTQTPYSNENLLAMIKTHIEREHHIDTLFKLQPTLTHPLNAYVFREAHEEYAKLYFDDIEKNQALFASAPAAATQPTSPGT